MKNDSAVLFRCTSKSYAMALTERLIYASHYLDKKYALSFSEPIENFGEWVVSVNKSKSLNKSTFNAVVTIYQAMLAAAHAVPALTYDTRRDYFYIETYNISE